MSIRKFRVWPVVLIAAVIFLVGCSGSSAALTGSSWPGYTVHNDTIYLASGPQVFAVDPADGHALWRFPAQTARGQTFYAPPAVTDDLVVVGDYSGALFALNPENGNQVWAFQPEKADASRFIAGAVIGDSLVYAATVKGVIYAFDRDTGAEAWRFRADRDVWSAPLLSDGVLYFTTLDRHLYAIDADSGDLRWQFPAVGVTPEDSPVGPMVGTPMVHDGTLYFGSFNNAVFALDIASQTLLWSHSTSNWVWSSPVFDEDSGLLIGGDLDGHVFALDPATGDEKWSYATEGPVVGTPALADRNGKRVAYVTSGDSKLYIIDVQTGELIDTPVSVTGEFTQQFLIIPTGSSVRPIPVYAPPLLVDNLVLVGSHQGGFPLIAYDQETLRQEWIFDPSAGS